MTADEIHDQNMSEAEVTEGSGIDNMEFYSRAVAKYELELLPLRADADEGRGDYDEFDEAFNEHLEEVFWQVREEATLLDAAPDLLNACKLLLLAYQGGEPGESVSWEDLDDAVAAAQEAVAKAEAKSVEST
jgi:hypothetical protein